MIIRQSSVLHSATLFQDPFVRRQFVALALIASVREYDRLGIAGNTTTQCKVAEIFSATLSAC